MYGDTVVMRRRAGQLREQGADIRAAAERLVSRSEAVPWRGRAADAMRERVKERATHLRAAANAHDTAADSLERHLAEVDRLKEAVAEAERRIGGQVAEAQHRVEATAYDDTTRDSAASEHDHALAGVALPPSGHADWLTLELPGSR
jgi:hypothetical protein